MISKSKLEERIYQKFRSDKFIRRVEQSIDRQLRRKACPGEEVEASFAVGNIAENSIQMKYLDVLASIYREQGWKTEIKNESKWLNSWYFIVSSEIPLSLPAFEKKGGG